MYLCAEWKVDAYQKYVENQWEVDVNDKTQQANQANKPFNAQIQLQDCVKLFATKETLTKDDAWYIFNFFLITNFLSLNFFTSWLVQV